MRSLILASACALTVCALAACGGGGGGGGGHHPAIQTIKGAGFAFRAPGSWLVKRRGTEVSALPKPTSTELVSVSVFPLLHPYKPSLFAAVTRELDVDAKQLASRLNGHVSNARTTNLAGFRTRQYLLFYTRGKTNFREQITFFLRGKTEFQLLCQWDASKPEPDYCRQLTRTFTPT